MARKPQGWTLVRDRRTKIIHVRFRTPDGQRLMRSTGTRERGEGQAQAARIVREESAKVRSVERGRTALDDEIVGQWSADHGAGKSPKTMESYEEYAALHWMPRWSSLQAIEPAAYVRDRLRVVTASAVRKEASALRSFLAWCAHHGHLDAAPVVPSVPKRATGTRFEGGKRTPRRVDLSPAQVTAILAALPKRTRRYGTPARDVVEFIWETTLRAATVERLERPRHYRPGATELHITADIDKARHDRRVPLSPRARAILDEHATEDGPIFGATHLRHALTLAAIAAGLSEDDARRVGPHDLRHAAVTALVSTPGASLAGAAYLAGHKHVSTTALYAHPGREAAEAALSARIGMQTRDASTNEKPAAKGRKRNPPAK